MKCPRCQTVNDDGRTICSKCGKNIYKADVNNRMKMTASQRAREDAKVMFKGFYKVFRVVWMILVIIVLSFWLLALMMWITGGTLGGV